MMKASDTTSYGVEYAGVSKRYPDGTVAVEHLDLHCPDGHITVFVGPSGCGKTTSLRMVNRMITPTGGTIRLQGIDVATMNENQMRRGMGYVIQNAGLFPHRTIEDNIATVPVLLGQSRREARRQVAGLMERVGLDPALAKRYPYQLSGGQQQRVGVARALAGDPPVLLMDEPFSAVDPLVRTELQQELVRLQADLKKTILFVTHDIDEAVTLGDQIAVFQHGGVLAQVASPEELLTRPANEFVESFVGRDSGVKWMSLIDAGDVALATHDLVTPSQATLRADGRPILVIDENRRAIGWKVNDGDLIPCRRTFAPAQDSLRSVIDSMLLSPADAAVATSPSGEVIGLADYSAVAAVIDQHRRSRHD